MEDMEEEDYNPWEVSDINEFNRLCCPECVYRTKEYSSFKSHSLKNHPKSVTFFKPKVKVKNESFKREVKSEVVKKTDALEDPIQLEGDEISSSFNKIDNKFEILDKLDSARINLQKKLENGSTKGKIWAKNENLEKIDTLKDLIQIESSEKSDSSKVTLNESQASNKINSVHTNSQEKMQNEPMKGTIWARNENLEKSNFLKDPIELENLPLNYSEPIMNQSKKVEKEHLDPLSINSKKIMQNGSNGSTIWARNENLHKSESLKDPIELEDMDLSCPDPMINQSKVEEKMDLEETLKSQEKNLNVFYCCPECAYKSKDVNLFQIHALENHPMSVPLFMDDDTNNR